MKFTKIKLKKGEVELHYQHDKGEQGIDKFTLNSKDEPLASFELSIKKLRKHVLGLLEMPKADKEIKKVTVTSVSLSYAGDDDIMGAVISGVRSLEYSNGVQVLNTPYKPEEPIGENADDANILPEECTAIIYELIIEAEKYLEGERKQIEMFPKDKKSDKPETTYIVKSKGKYVNVAAGYSNRMTQLVNEVELDLIDGGNLNLVGDNNNYVRFEKGKKDELIIVGLCYQGAECGKDDLAPNVVQEAFIFIEKLLQEGVAA